MSGITTINNDIFSLGPYLNHFGAIFVCDGVLVATAAGSTAYNLSAHGSIIPLNSNLLALTPISAFRPRRWRGALLQHNTNIKFEVIDNINRPVSVTADHSEFRNIVKVDIISSQKSSCKILLDSKHSMEERVLKEQFYKISNNVIIKYEIKYK